MTRGFAGIGADKRFLQAVQQHRISAGFLVPTQIHGLLGYPDLDHWDRSSLQYLLYGASPIAPARLAEAITRFGAIFGQRCGQAEVPMSIRCLDKQAHYLERPERLQSCGRVLPGNQLRLPDEQRQEVPVGDVGELCVRGPLVMDGCLNRSDDTEEAFAGGWLHTEDMARVDAQGYLYLVDRAKDMIISGGFNVYPSEVEACLALHPAVAQSAVIGVPDAKWGEAVVGLVVLEPGASATAQALKDFVHASKGALLTPKQLWLEPELPVAAVGKSTSRPCAPAFGMGKRGRWAEGCPCQRRRSILTASVAAQVVQVGQVIDGSAKAGVNSLVLPMARDLSDLGIRVNCIMPGIFATPLMLGAKQAVPRRVRHDRCAEHLQRHRAPPRLGHGQRRRPGLRQSPGRRAIDCSPTKDRLQALVTHAVASARTGKTTRPARRMKFSECRSSLSAARPINQACRFPPPCARSPTRPPPASRTASGGRW